MKPETTVINGVMYKVSRSTWYSDHSALFLSYDGGKTWPVENNTFREFDNIKANPDQLAALKVLWPNLFK